MVHGALSQLIACVCAGPHSGTLLFLFAHYPTTPMVDQSNQSGGGESRTKVNQGTLPPLYSRATFRTFAHGHSVPELDNHTPFIGSLATDDH